MTTTDTIAALALVAAIVAAVAAVGSWKAARNSETTVPTGGVDPNSQAASLPKL
ncbi:hypothetical protein ACFY3M_43655 [Streptomyces mirabilis]|uniref:hypothetical protein n=1 Tax=Streptomyces mirabilis TaxID=68239 RepID=UPI0036B5C401